MDKVLIFTCIDRWDDISEMIQERVPSWEENYPTSGCPIAMCDCSQSGSAASLNPIGNIIAKGVYLLYDDIPTNDLDALFQSCQTDKKYILIHTNGNSAGYDFGQWNDCVVRHGMHENFPTERYYRVFDILTDNEDNKPQRIIDNVFAPLNEEVLQFLNGCLVPQNQTTEFLGAWHKLQAALANDMALRKDLDNFMIKYNSSKSLNDYQKELVALRDKLWAFAETY